MLLPPGRYAMLRPLAILSAMSFAASMRRSSIMPGPAAFVASEMSRADSDSPSALMTAAFRSCICAHVTPSQRSEVGEMPNSFCTDTLLDQLCDIRQHMRAVCAWVWQVDSIGLHDMAPGLPS